MRKIHFLVLLLLSPLIVIGAAAAVVTIAVRVGWQLGVASTGELFDA